MMIILRPKIDRLDSLEKQMDNVSREMEILRNLRKNQKEMLD